MTQELVDVVSAVGPPVLLTVADSGGGSPLTPAKKAVFGVAVSGRVKAVATNGLRLGHPGARESSAKMRVLALKRSVETVYEVI